MNGQITGSGVVVKELPSPQLTSERCLIQELYNQADSSDALSDCVSVARCIVEVGVTTQLHSLSVSERYVIERGLGRMRLADDEPYDLSPGDIVLIPAGCPQQITNTGNEPLEFLCICSPRFEESHYRNLEGDE